MRNEVQRILNDKGLLEPHTYEEPPMSMRWKFVLLRNWPLPLFLVLAVIATIFLVVTNGFTSGTVALIGLVLVPLALIGTWATYWHGLSNFQPFYEVKGVKVEFESTKYYVPSSVMGPFLQEVFDSFSNVVDFDPATLFKGVRLVIKDERPYDPLDRVPPERMVGLTFPGRKLTSYVYGPYALSHGGAGYEMRLQGCGFLFPGRSEEDDIEWMRENDVL